MTILKIPKEISFNDIKLKKSLSPSNYKSFEIDRNEKIELKYFLDDNNPYNKGQEPGSVAYVKKSDVKFVRNSCINSIDTSYDRSKVTCLNPKYEFTNMISHEDVLLCRDANIGDTCLFIKENEEDIYVHSSGIVKLNFKSEDYKYYCISMIKDSYFINQLDAVTPKGSTIRHSGDLFLDCKIPKLRKSEEWVYALMKSIIKNIAYTEYNCNKKLRYTEKIIDEELMTKKYKYSNPLYLNLEKEKRLDAGIYSESVFQWKNNVDNYINGSCTIQEFGFDLKRGPNLAKRDLGRSMKSETWKKNFNILVYPSDIAESGYIDKYVYLGARNKIWFLENKNILFSTEGTVGKTFIICNENMRFTTNFHGTIVYPINDDISIDNAIFLGLYLNYLKSKNILKKMSVGGNGGSFALGYWDYIKIPKFNNKLISDLAKIYNNECDLNPFIFNDKLIKESGIFQLSLFRMKCNEALKYLIEDIKNERLQDKSFYIGKV
ncbi:hypothetical protein [Paraclostridium bifermentans]|uniref:hypothetical protein n=1 Tax=Paraclostridium bifermentans TaxID=1490 RepID=UPI00189A12A1|nr:hypothetical protein [Paraclostridium bifermentans]